MAKHKLETDFTNKKGEVKPFRCKICYRTWTNKPKGDCQGKPFKNVEQKAPTEQPKPKPKSKPRKKVDRTSAEVHILGGELSRIDRKYLNDPLNRQRIRRAYLKNLRMGDS